MIVHKETHCKTLRTSAKIKNFMMVEWKMYVEQSLLPIQSSLVNGFDSTDTIVNFAKSHLTEK